MCKCSGEGRDGEEKRKEKEGCREKWEKKNESESGDFVCPAPGLCAFPDYLMPVPVVVQNTSHSIYSCFSDFPSATLFSSL
jgi:hypothetical protein